MLTGKAKHLSGSQTDGLSQWTQGAITEGSEEPLLGGQGHAGQQRQAFSYSEAGETVPFTYSYRYLSTYSPGELSDNRL